MKKRFSFVSNSSSCSFVIHKSHLNSEKTKAIKKFIEESEDGDEDDEIDLYEEENYLYSDSEALYHSEKFWELLKKLDLKESIDYVRI